MYLMQTVSSAPVARLRDQERSNFVDVESMETRGTNHHTRPESYKSETTQWTNSEDKSKKSKKWSIGKLFRRKKKESDTDSMTSDENSQKSVKKKKQSRKQADEVDGPHQQRSQSVMKVSNNKEHFDEGVLSDPSAGFVGYVGRGLPRSPFDRTHRSSRESLDKKGIDSLDGSLKKGKKGRIKARVEAIRNLKHESSSDDESQKSTSSSMMRFRSDDSLANHSKGEPNSKRSRSARTDRYIKRLSRDEEVSYGKEIENIQQILNRTSAEMMLKQRILSNPQINQYNIEEPEYYEPQKATYAVPAKPERSFSSGYLPSNLRQTITDSNSSVYSYPVGVINLNAKVNDENITYSIPYNSVNKTHTNKPQYRPENNNNYENEDVMVVKFPIGNVNHQVKKENVAPPVPPPRDPQRKVSTPLSYMYDNTRPISYNNSMHKMNGDVTKPINTYENSVPYRNENSLSWNKRPISTSVDHIAIQNNYQNIPPNCYQYNQPKRPSSVSAEVINPDIYNRYMSRPMINQIKPPISNNQNQEYLYFTDKTPRSRKPIHITPGVNVTVPINRPRNASEFWRKLDSQESQRRTLSTRTMSDQAISGPVPNLNVITNGDHTKRASISDHSTKSVKKDEPICYSNIDIIPMDDVRKDRKSHSGNSSDDDQSKRKKSTNLDDALSELEAIYNSLGLGDEDLLDRAEKRELMTPKSTEAFPFNSSSRDSFRLPNSPDIAKRLNRRSSIPDKLFDDMAFRRLNPSERPKSKDVNNLVSQISYMLASPALLEPLDVVPKCIPKTIEPEPDIVYDDVAFRNIRQKNNYLKTIDPQPPFGIPLGLVSPAPYSDYLHAIPDIKDKKPIQQDEPDLVTDDLAFRALRKDCKSQYDEENINKYIVPNPNQPSTIFDNHVIRKKRAVRSLSANIFTMIQKEIDDALEMCNNKPMEKTQSIPDLPESVIEFGKNGKLPEERKDVPNSYQTNASNTKKEEEKLMSRPPLASETKQEINNTKYPMKVTIEKKFNHPSDKNNFTVDYSTTVYTDRPQNVRITHETNMMNDANKADTSSQQTKEYKEHKDIPKTDTKGKCTEDSLIEISTHLNRIGDKIKLNPELKDNFEEEGMKLQALAKKCDIDLNDNMHQAKLNIESSLYKFLPKTNNDTVEMNKLSDKNSNSYNAKGDAIDKMTSFEDLRKGINDLLQGITQVSDKFNMKSNIIETRKESPLPDDDIDKRKDSRESPEYNSSEELAMIFNLGPESTTTKSIVVESKNLLPDKHLDLNSPRLVKNVNQNLIRQSSQERELGESSKASTSAIVESSSNDIPWRKPKREPSNDNTNRGNFHDRQGPSTELSSARKPSIFNTSSAFRPVKPSKPTTSIFTTASKFETTANTQKPFFEDIKSIARSFGEIIEFSERSKRNKRSGWVFGNEIEGFDAYCREHGDLTKVLGEGGGRRVKRRPERRVTVHCVEDVFRDGSVDMPEARAAEVSSTVAAMDDGKVERIRKYKEERRKQLAVQCNVQPTARTTRLATKKVASPKSEETADNGRKNDPASARVRTTRTSRLRAAASSGDPPTSQKDSKRNSCEIAPGAISSAKLNSTTADVNSKNKNDLVDSTNENRQVLSNNSIVLVDNDDRVNENGAPDGRRAFNEICDIDTVIKLNESLSNSNATVVTSSTTVEDNVSKKALEMRLNGEDNTTMAKSVKTAKHQPKNKESDEASNVRRGRLVSSRLVAKTENCQENSAGKSPPNVRNGSLINKQSSHRSSSQSPLSSTNAVKSNHPKRRSVDLSPKASTANNTSLTVIDLNPFPSNDVKKTTGAAKLEKPATELNRTKRRSLSLVTDTRNHSGSAAKNKAPEKSANMTPGVDKTLKHMSANADVGHKTYSKTSSFDSSYSKLNNSHIHNRRLTSRMDALEALTKETFAKVNRLARRAQDSHKSNDSTASNGHAFINNLKTESSAPSTSKQVQDKLSDSVIPHLVEISNKPSEPLASMLSYTPISILKRKSLQEDHNSSGTSSGNVATPPVTFSPSVVDPPDSKSRRRGQGILKKRRSLDESQVNRHRSCSPEVAFVDDTRSRPILKSQRRSSLEEVIRGRSPDGQIQGILKRKCSRDSDFIEDRSLGSPEPQGILKRKSNSSSSSSTTSSHVSITQAVILAAAKGAILVEEKDGVRPILKKKSFSEERPCTEIYNIDGPKPILKKKSLTECDYSDYDRPTKTILKFAHKVSGEDASSFDNSEEDRSLRWSSLIRHKTVDGTESESGFRPILKQRASSQSREHSQSPRHKLSCCSDDERAIQLPCNLETLANDLINRLAQKNTASEGSPPRQSDDDDLPKSSKFMACRLQSPSLIKDFMEPQSASYFPSVALRRRDLRPKDVNRSKSLVSKFTDELDTILNSRRSCDDGKDSESSRDSSPDGVEAAGDRSAVQSFPSIAQRIQSMEQYLMKDCSGIKKALGTVPKRQFRSKERFRTQPVTVDELQKAGLDVGQGNFECHVADRATSARASDNSTGVLALSTPAEKIAPLDHRRHIESIDPISFSPISTKPLETFVAPQTENTRPDSHPALARLKSVDANSTLSSNVSAFSDLTFSPEVLKNYLESSNKRDSVNVNSEENSPVTREFNRLLKDYRKESKASESLNFTKLILESENISSLDVLDASILKSRPERPLKLFENETGYRKGSREAALQELDKLETELENVRVALDADSTALSSADPDHWSLNVSVDSGVFNRMSSGDSGPLSEEASLHQDVIRDTDLYNNENELFKKPKLESDHKSRSFEVTNDITMATENVEPAADNPEELFGLMKSNSVSARACMWQQLQDQATKGARPVMRHSRLKAKDGSPTVLERFKTQPITFGEVNNAVNENSSNPLEQSRSSFSLSMEQDDDAKLDENDPAKLTLAEKMKLFGTSTASPKPPICVRKTRSPRFQTMPVLSSQVEDAKEMNKMNNRVSLEPTEKDNSFSNRSRNSSVNLDLDMSASDGSVKIESIAERLNRLTGNGNSPGRPPVVRDEDFKPKNELGMNFRLAQSKLAEQASRMLTTEVRGILKSRSGAIPLLPSASEGNNIYKKNPDHKNLPPLVKKQDENHSNQKEITNTDVLIKGESSEGLNDEGIESSSEDESVSQSSHSSDQSCTSSDTSDESEDEEASPTLVKPSQLKSSKTDSDINIKATKDNSMTDCRIKLPCMDEMRARKIMEKCMSKSEKENTPKSKVAKAESAFVKLNNIKNGDMDVKDKTEAAKKCPLLIVNKSKSAHSFDSPQVNDLRLQNRMNEELAARLKVPADGSGSDGESSGGREVRQITSRRRPQRALPPQGAKRPEDGVSTQGLRRSATQPMAAAMPQQGNSIAERLKALQQSGNNDWRKRLQTRISPDEDVTNIISAKNKINETLTQQHEETRKIAQVDPAELSKDMLISDRRNQLETSSQNWKKRIGPSDATLFSVAGRMDRDKAPPSPIVPLLPPTDGQTPIKKTPVAARFKSRRMEAGPVKSASSAAVSQPASPHKTGIGEFRRSISVSGVDDLTIETNGESYGMTKSQDGSMNGEGPSVSVPRADDETFTSFFTSASQTVLTSTSVSHIPYNNNDITPISEDIDLDVIDSGTRHLLGGAAVNRVRAARRAGGSKNPLKALAARTDLRQEYTEIPSTGLADKEAARLKKEKLVGNSPMAVEALAGLASREDFSNVHLKKAIASSPSFSSNQVLSKQPLLIHVKGRRRVQARIVEPHYESINSGDSFILVTPDQVFLYMGYYANVIERTRGAEIALHIHSTKDLGCMNSIAVITLDEQVKHRSNKCWKQFWNLLGLIDDAEEFTPTAAGNADEDEIFESGIIPTNICYEVIDDELVPIQEFWGQIPKISMLDPSKILVFDFGSEMYVWNGKNTILEKRRMAFQLAQELWDEGYDYKDCIVCPVSIHQMLGAREKINDVVKKSNKRPDWAVLSKVTQHMENILFRDKFLDWPDFSRVIKVKEDEETLKSSSSEIKPYDAEEMKKNEYIDPSLELEGSQVGRGTHYYDKETMRHFEVKTKSVKKWVIQEYGYLEIGSQDLGEFYSADSYIIRWEYQLNVSGRELTGKPSKHNLTGRDRCAYFCWQGKDATPNEKGAAALLTVELDHEKGPQIRVTQGSEPPAFLNLFKGTMKIHQGKKGNDKNRYRMYMTRGNVVNESHIVQVTCSMRQLRSRASMLIVDSELGHIHVWHGAKSLKHTKTMAVEMANHMKQQNIFNSDVVEVKITEIYEGDEPKSVIEALGGANRQLYHSLIDKDNKTSDVMATTPRLFHFTDISGQFVANEILSPLRYDNLVTPYPFSQKDLYSVSQPGLFLYDNGDVLWVWQGWLPQNEDGDSAEVGAGLRSIRWQECRKAALETVLRYWELCHPDGKETQAFITIAGLEPLQFTNLFDIWQDRDDIAEINMMQGYKGGEGGRSVVEELARLSRTSFPLAVLRQRPLPDGVDPANIERYLTNQQFEETFGMKKEAFRDLPSWKQVNMKKELGLF